MADPFKFNAFQIKRQAHAVSRSDPNWNPFRHVWSERHQRSQSRNSAEASLEHIDAEPLQHSISAPNPSRPLDQSSPNGSPSDRIASPVDDGGPLPYREGAGNNSLWEVDPRDHQEPEEKKRKARRMSKRVETREPFTVANQIQRTFLAAWSNFLLPCVPAGIILGAVLGPSLPTFFVNFAAVIPLYWLGDFAMTEIGLRTGDLVANYIGISTSNLVQLISCILLLVHGQLTVLKTTLIGGILANILLLLGLGMVFGGRRRPEQYFNRTSSHTSSVLLSLASTSLLIPTASLLMSQTNTIDVTKQSRGASVILVIVYGLYLYFSLHTHRTIFEEDARKVPQRPRDSALPKDAIKKGLVAAVGVVGLPDSHAGEPSNNALLQMMAQGPQPGDYDDGEEYEAQLHIGVALTNFVATTVLLYFCVDYVVNSIDALTSRSGLSNTFVGVVLLPILNCDFTPVYNATSDNMNATMDYTVGKSIQTALLVTPFTVLLAWWLGIDGVTLVFDGFEVVSLFATVLLLNLIISEGKSNWVMGVLLLADWALVAIAAFFVM
ncbi:hypothetical protein VPNG_06421 [Cytospora leucostoma]|uniref:Sodium/calcium exchanger membrane region domain-containing protein n=1 Tax=Cytospora leucostoma TaxID=1230097 RepID=A0A423WZ52_9PEZI|nr:hypothetical protein VPNG_06421 [Cytospora leucostoma]